MTTGKSVPVAVQLYSLRHFSSDFATQIATVAEMGYPGVELVGLSMPAEEARDILAQHGVKAVSAHVSIQAMREDIDKVMNFHQVIGNSYLIVPAPPQDVREANTVDAWVGLARELAELGRRCIDADLRIGYHNHWWEMAEIDGKRVVDWMMEETSPDYLFLEPDLAWVTKGGADAEAILKQYTGRCPRVHVKDLAAAGQNEDQMGLADVGYGTLNWDVLLPAARAAGAEWYVVEHDLPKDPPASVQRSLEFLRSKSTLLG
ncbi:TIM barrel protein [bacterium]|nr:TIM barrel protein [bacterium]